MHFVFSFFLGGGAGRVGDGAVGGGGWGALCGRFNET